MTVSFIGVGAQGASNTNGATVTYNWPSGYSPVAGDVAFVFQTGWWTQPSSASPPDGPAPSGYTFIAKSSRDATASLCYASSWYYKLLTGAESAPQVTLTSTYASATNVTNGFVCILRGVDMDDMFDGGAVTYTSGSATTLTISSFSSTENNVIAIGGVGQGGQGAIVSSGGGTTWTYRATGASYDTSLGSNSSAGLATKSLATAGALGFHGWTSTATAGWAGVALRVNSAVTPGVPTSLTVGTTTGTAVDLSWTAPASTGGQAITDYLIEWSTNNFSSVLGSAYKGSATASYTVSGLTNGTTYYFRVAAVNAVGTGGYSSTASATTDTVPGAPTSLVVGASTTSSVAFSWTAPSSDGGSSITDYTVQWSTNGSTWTTFIDGVSTTTSTTVTALPTPGTTFFFRVAAVNAVGTGAYSASISAATTTESGGSGGGGEGGVVVAGQTVDGTALLRIYYKSGWIG